MEPTSSPDNTRQSRGLARFWPVHGMPAPVQRPSDEDARPGRADAGGGRGDAGPGRGDAGPARGDAGPARGDAGPARGDAGPARGDAEPPRPAADARFAPDAAWHAGDPARSATDPARLAPEAARAVPDAARPAPEAARAVPDAARPAPEAARHAPGAARSAADPAGEASAPGEETADTGADPGHPALTSDTQMVALGSRRPFEAGPNGSRMWTGNQGGFPPVESERPRNGDSGPRHGGAPVPNGLPPAADVPMPAQRPPLPPPASPFAPPPSPGAQASGPPSPFSPAAQASGPPSPFAPPAPVPGAQVSGPPPFAPRTEASGGKAPATTGNGPDRDARGAIPLGGGSDSIQVPLPGRRRSAEEPETERDGTPAEGARRADDRHGAALNGAPPIHRPDGPDGTPPRSAADARNGTPVPGRPAAGSTVPPAIRPTTGAPIPSAGGPATGTPDPSAGRPATGTPNLSAGGPATGTPNPSAGGPATGTPGLPGSSGAAATHPEANGRALRNGTDAGEPGPRGTNPTRGPMPGGAEANGRHPSEAPGNPVPHPEGSPWSDQPRTATGWATVPTSGIPTLTTTDRQAPAPAPGGTADRGANGDPTHRTVAGPAARAGNPAPAGPTPAHAGGTPHRPAEGDLSPGEDLAHRPAAGDTPAPHRSASLADADRARPAQDPHRPMNRAPRTDHSTPAAAGPATAGDPAAPQAARRAATAPPAEAGLRPGDVNQISIAFWDEEAIAHYRSAWHELRGDFVDDPVTALNRAHDLLTEAVNELTEALLAERDELDPLRTTATPDTESMRMAMRGYREFLDRILAL